MALPPFQSLIDAHGRDVHRFLTATVGAQAADDCYQETWLAALAAYPRVRAATSLRGWVMTIAHNKAMDHHRARARAPVTGVADGLAPALPVDPMPAPVDAAPDDELWARVAALPVKQRAAIALRFLADAAYGDIAAAMQTSEEAARRNVHEGLKRLRREVVR
jgi:RNA polymerase sigma factor (sigma-70 family)